MGKTNFKGECMKIAIGSDERTNLTDRIVEELLQREHEVIPFGSLAENDLEVDS